jgi:2-C-methyl-D-erythritol 4-phosphate cytidylyltransferase
MKKELFSYPQIAILLMAGMGERFGAPYPKQFVEMAGKPLFVYSAQALNDAPEIPFILYVIPKGYEKQAEDEIKKAGLAKKHALIEGGLTRGDSSHLGVKYLASHGANPEAIILIQDAARPNLTPRLIQENLEAARKSGASVTALESSDSVAIVKEPGLVDGYIPRDEVFLLQTPQAFRLSVLLDAFGNAKDDIRLYTDEGSLVLAKAGIQPAIVRGDKDNFKITEPDDKVRFEKISL